MVALHTARERKPNDDDYNHDGDDEHDDGDSDGDGIVTVHATGDVNYSEAGRY